LVLTVDSYPENDCGTAARKSWLWTTIAVVSVLVLAASSFILHIDGSKYEEKYVSV